MRPAADIDRFGLLPGSQSGKLTPSPLPVVRYEWPVTMKTFMNSKSGRVNQAGQIATPYALMIGKSTLHCGRGCTLADICTERLAFASPQLRQNWIDTGLFQI